MKLLGSGFYLSARVGRIQTDDPEMQEVLLPPLSVIQGPIVHSLSQCVR